MASQGASVVDTYEPVLRMQEKAAALRAELQVQQQANSAEQHKANLRERLTVRISEPGGPAAKPDRIPATPANPRFKPQRPHIGRSTSGASDLQPSRSLRRGVSGVSAVSGLTTIISNNSLGFGNQDSLGAFKSNGTNQEPTSPTGSHSSHVSRASSRRSASPKRSKSTLKMSLAMQEMNQQLSSRAFEAEEAKGAAERKMLDMQEEMQRRQTSYMRREEQMQAQIEDLQTQLARAKGERSSEAAERFGKASTTIKELHAKVEGEIEELLNKQSVALKHEEQTTLRRFKSRLAEVEAELGAERGAAGRSNSDWMERTRALRQELDTVQEIANKLDKMYRLSEEECSRLRAQFKAQEDDREFLIRQMVALKKENKRLTVELAAMAADAQAATQERDDLMASHAALGDPHHPMMPAQMAATMTLAGIDKDAIQVKVQRYEDVIESLKRLVEAERKRTRQARAAHTSELAARTELQTILRQCVDDVRERRRHVEMGEDIPGLSSLGGLGAGSDSHREQREALGIVEEGGGEDDDLGFASGSGAGTPPPGSGRSSVSGQSGISTGAGSRASGQARPISAMPATGSLSRNPDAGRGALGVGTSGRPGSGRTGPSNFASNGGPRLRPFSAVPRMMHQRPISAFGRLGTARAAVAATAGTGGGGAGSSPGAVDEAVPLMSEEREALVQELMAREDLLKLIFERAFPTVAPPTLPGETDRLDRLAAARETRDATVVANARALAFMRGQGQGQAPSGGTTRHAVPANIKDATPGGELAKEGAGKPWVFSVDAMLADFLSGKSTS